jgi:hypothetical protein
VTVTSLGKAADIGRPATAQDVVAITSMLGEQAAPMEGEPLTADDIAAIANFNNEVDAVKDSIMSLLGDKAPVSIANIANQAINNSERSSQPDMDEGITGLGNPQSGGVYGGKDATPAEVAAAEVAAATARGDYTGNDEGITGLDGYGTAPSAPSAPSSPSASSSPSSPSVPSGDEGIFGFAKGGMASMEQQMRLFEEGGIADDGLRRDPVSGNEIPPGSLAEEVRDDVPAQLSEGEYVVPADVVRFFGVKFFEDLRSQAKSGLMNMEANGRIGGEPVAQTIDNQTGGELTPEELAALEQITGMAMGGVVQPTQSTNPYLQQQQMYQQPAPVAMGNTGFNKGGSVLYAQDGVDVSNSDIDPYTAQFSEGQMSMFAPGFMIDQTTGTASTSSQQPRTVTLYGPGGEVITVTLPAQQDLYDELLQEGYSETPVQTTTETKVGEDGDGGRDAPPDQIGIDVSTLSDQEIADAIEGLENNTSLESKALDFMGKTFLGKAMEALTGKSPRDKALEDYKEEQDRRGTETPPTKDTTDAPSADPTPSDATPSENGPFSGTPMGPTPAQEAQADLEAQISIDAFGGDTAPTGDPDAPGTGDSSPSADAPGVGDANNDGVSDGAASSSAAGSGHEGNADPDAGGSMLNTGGMVKRRTKKKK